MCLWNKTSKSEKAIFNVKVTRSYDWYCFYLKGHHQWSMHDKFEVYIRCLKLTTEKQSDKQHKAKEKYRGMFEIQMSGDKTSSGEIGLDIKTHASPKVGQDQVSGGVSVLCWHAAPVAYVQWKPYKTIRIMYTQFRSGRIYHYFILIYIILI